MDHQVMRDKLFALYDGELSAADRKDAEAHLVACSECRSRYEGWSKTARVLFQARKPAPSEFFVTQVMKGIYESEIPAKASGWRVSLGWMVPAIGLVLVMAAIMPLPPQRLSVDELLAQEANNSSPWVYSNKALSTDETLQFVMEG